MLRTFLPLCATALLLTACSGGSDNPDVDDTADMVNESGESGNIAEDGPPATEGTEADSETITLWGSVIVFEELENNTVGVAGDFFDISATPRSVADVLNDPPRTVDSCDGSVSTLNENPENFEIPEDDPVPISAGETITLSSQGNTYATLLRQGSDFIFYSDENSLTGPAPTGLTVDIPGDEFPSLTNVRIPDVPVLQMISPTIGEPITPFTQFSWIGAGTQNTFASIRLRYTDSETGEVVFVFCGVVDDGSFSFPTEIQALIKPDVTPDFVGFTRATRDALVFGNAVINVTNTTSIDF